MSLDNLKNGIMVLVFVSILGAAGAIALGDFGSGLTANSYEKNVTNNGLAGIGNATSYLDTIGTLLGVSALVAIVVGAFFYFGRR